MRRPPLPSGYVTHSAPPFASRARAAPSIPARPAVSDGRLLIDLSWNSNRLEGNTYSLLETERWLELGETGEGKDALAAR